MPLKRALARTMASAFFDDELRLRQDHWKIIGKTKKSGFCMTYSVVICSYAYSQQSKMADTSVKIFQDSRIKQDIKNL
jgi:hypothetical protein